jgi:hypothetical protein
MPAPFLSLVIDDCIATGADYNAGGARYNTTYIMPVGIGTVTDSLSAIRCHVFEQRTVAMPALLGALARDFSGDEALRQRLWNRTPRYGNDDPAADRLLQRVFDAIHELVDGRPNTRGGAHHLNYLSTTCHGYFGFRVGATADGRHARQPVSDGISPVQGSDRQGPTAVLKSAGRMDHARTGGTLLNLKLTPAVLDDDGALDRLGHLVRGYFALDGHHLQFNVVTAETAVPLLATPPPSGLDERQPQRAGALDGCALMCDYVTHERDLHSRAAPPHWGVGAERPQVRIDPRARSTAARRADHARHRRARRQPLHRLETAATVRGRTGSAGRRPSGGRSRERGP